METMVRKTQLETILCSQNRLSGMYTRLDGKEICVCHEINLKCGGCMASHMEWHQPVQEAVWLRLFLFKNEVGNIAKTAT